MMCTVLRWSMYIVFTWNFMSIVWHYYLCTYYFALQLCTMGWEKDILKSVYRGWGGHKPGRQCSSQWVTNWFFIYMYAFMHVNKGFWEPMRSMYMEGCVSQCDVWRSMYSWEMKRCIKCCMWMILMMGINGNCYSYLGSRVYSFLIYPCLNSIAPFVVIYACLWNDIINEN